MDYDQFLDSLFSDLEINLVRHDASPTGLPAYIEAHIKSPVKKANRGILVKDLGNYIYRRFGLRYQLVPEFRGKGKSTTVRWFMSWDDIQPIMPNIYKAMTLPRSAPLKADHYLPFEFNKLIIQNTSRGVVPRQQESA